jgi:ketosteroid isomerase-like protein
MPATIGGAVDPELERRIRAGYAAFARGDLETALEHFEPDATMTNPDYDLEAGVLRGRDEVAAALRSLHEWFEYEAVEIEDLIEGPEGVLVVVHFRARGRGSGVPADARFFHAFRTEEGRAAALSWFTTEEEGRRAVGLA